MLTEQLTKEARVISNSGVLIAESEISVPLADGSRISIDLVRYIGISSNFRSIHERLR